MDLPILPKRLSMYLRYLRKSDYFQYIKPRDLDQLTGGNDTLLYAAEMVAVEDVVSYLVNEYAILETIAQGTAIQAYDHSKVYAEGEYVFVPATDGNDAYQEVYCITDHWQAGHTLTGNPESFVQDDPRNSLLIKHTACLAIYNLFLRVSPENIPVSRIRAMEHTMEWLKKCSKLAINPGIPPKTTDNGGRVSDWVVFSTQVKDNGSWFY